MAANTPRQEPPELITVNGYEVLNPLCLSEFMAMMGIHPSEKYSVSFDNKKLTIILPTK